MVVQLDSRHFNSKYPGSLDMIQAQNLAREFLCTDAELSELAEKYCLTKEDVFKTVRIYVKGRPDLHILYQNKVFEEITRFDSYEKDSINDSGFINYSYKSLIKYSEIELIVDTKMSNV